MTNSITLALFLAHWPQVNDFVPTQAQLYALSYVESRHRDAKRGAAHEITRFQMLPSIWRQFSGGVKWNPKDPAVRLKAFDVARKAWSYDVRHSPWHPALPSNELLYAAWQQGWVKCKKLGWRLDLMPRLTQRKAREFAAKVRELEGK